MLQNRDYRLKQENTDFVKQQLSTIEKPPETVDVSGGCPAEPFKAASLSWATAFAADFCYFILFIHFSNGIVSILKVSALIVCLNLGGV